MAKEPEVYQSIDSIPTGHAKNWLVPGCMVLEGGALRGTYTSGVLDALMQENINLQTTIGVSAGALVGLHYVSGQIGRAGRMNLIYRHDERYVGLACCGRSEDSSLWRRTSSLERQNSSRPENVTTLCSPAVPAPRCHMYQSP